MYFDFVYGILFDDRIITRKTRKSHRNTENIEILLSVCCTSPVPHTESTEINGMHEKGDRGGAKPSSTSAVVLHFLYFSSGVLSKRCPPPSPLPTP